MSHRSDRIGHLVKIYEMLLDSQTRYLPKLSGANTGHSQDVSNWISIREHDTAELRRHLNAIGVTTDCQRPSRDALRTGSSANDVSRPNELSLPGWIEHEERLALCYDEALRTSPLNTPEYSALITQRQALRTRISQLKRCNELAA